MDPFATLEDISILWRELKESEYSKAEKLLTVVSDSLRYEANKVGKDLDNMIEQNEALRNVAKYDIDRHRANDTDVSISAGLFGDRNISDSWRRFIH